MELFHDFVPTNRASRVVFPNGHPRVLFPRHLRQRAWHYTQLDTEFAWRGTVREVGPRQFLLEEFYPTPQEASKEHVKLTKEGHAAMLTQWAREGEAGDARTEALRLWGHSHIDVGTEPSVVDDSTFEWFRAQKLPWFIRMIVNRHGAAHFTVFLDEGNIVIDPVPWSPVDVLDPVVADLARREIGANLTVVPTPPEVANALKGEESRTGCLLELFTHQRRCTVLDCPLRVSQEFGPRLCDGGGDHA